MSNDKNQGGNPNVLQQQFYPSMVQQQDALKLVNVWRILCRQKKISLITLLIFVVLGLAFAFLKSEKYAFSTVVQMGTFTNGEKSEHIETADMVLSKIKMAYIPLVLSEYYNKTPDSRERYFINVSVPKKSEIVVIQMEEQLNQADRSKELITNVVTKLINDHSVIVNIKIKNLEVSIAHAENVLSSTKDSTKLIEANIARLEKTSALLTTQLSEKKQMLEKVLQNRDSVKTSSATGAMSVLLIDSEIQRYQLMVDDLEKRLLIDLHQQRNELEKALADSLRNQNDSQNNIDQLKSQLANTANTRAIVPVLTSSDPVGLGKAAIIIIAILLGGVLGVLATLVYEFLQNTLLSKKTPAAN
jgi:uncharacterized protein involved in exopolysaccharide biosynthesis